MYIYWLETCNLNKKAIRNEELIKQNTNNELSILF